MAISAYFALVRSEPFFHVNLISGNSWIATLKYRIRYHLPCQRWSYRLVTSLWLMHH